MCALALAEHAGEVIAAALLVFFEGTAYYLHGGSADTKRELMAPFLLHFKAMEEAKQRGCTRYDFGGVRMLSKRDAGDTDWDGITRFKQGFAPKAETLVFPGTYDIILSPTRYALYRQSRRLRGIRRAYRLFVHCFQYEIV
jgi:lipid II:glycine glycyltransferase (peptidoglycan interpeptide bridge formation enzyme)